jgi:hypothetical protein
MSPEALGIQQVPRSRPIVLAPLAQLQRFGTGQAREVVAIEAVDLHFGQITVVHEQEDTDFVSGRALPCASGGIRPATGAGGNVL